MTELRNLLERQVASGSLSGAVAMIARGDDVDVQVAGSHDLEGTAPMARDSLVRIASITKPITAAAVLMLIEDGRIAMDDPIGQWLPELATPMVVRTPTAPVGDVVPARRAIAVEDLLTSRAGYGFPSEFSAPAVGPLSTELFDEPRRDGRDPQHFLPPDEWMAALSQIPLLHQPGDAWLYNTCSDLQGILIARVTGQPFPEFLAERLFDPLGMVDSGFHVPAGKLDRFTSYYRTDPAGGLELADAPGGQWSSPPAFPSGAGGLVGTIDDWHAFARMLLADGCAGDHQLLSPGSVRQMTTDQLTQSQRDGGRLFLKGQGWGFGGSVDVVAVDPWNLPGRYGWGGGTGTAAHLTPSTGGVTILFTQLAAAGPVPSALMRDFWHFAAGG